MSQYLTRWRALSPPSPDCTTSVPTFTRAPARAGPRLTSSLSGNHYLAPGDFGTIYNLPDYVNGVFQTGLDGTGQTIGIVGQASDSGVDGVTSIPIPSDNSTFRSVSGLPAANLTVTPVGSPPNFSNGEFEEATLDIQWAGAVAPNAAIVFAYSTNALTASLPYLVGQGQVSVISISYGECEADVSSSDYSAIEGYLSQANAQGQTVTAAAGDTGAADCDGTPQNPVSVATQGLAVDYPASSQYVTAMGGTEFINDDPAGVVNGVANSTQYWNSSSDPNDTRSSAFSYIPENAWNDTSTLGQNVATGGGVSKKFSKPNWQTGNGVPTDGQRDVPDLALTASADHDGYIICSHASCQNGYRSTSDQTFTVIGGTSAAAPSFAGIAALINQRLGNRQGNLNPQIYALAASAPWAFNDTMLLSSNRVPCQLGSPDCPNGGSIGFDVGGGYDLATGWGSIDAAALINAFNGTPNPHFVLLPSSHDVFVYPDVNVYNVPVSVTPKEGFSGNVVLTCALSPSLAGASCGFLFNPVTTPGSSNLAIQRGTLPSTTTGTVTVQGTSGSITSSLVLNVTATAPDFQLSSANSTETVATGGSTTDTITVTPVQGFTGTVAFSPCSGTSGLTCSLSSDVVVVTSTSPITSTLTVNASSSATTGSITLTAIGSSSSHTLQIPVNVTTVAPDFTLTVASPVVSIPSGSTITDNLSVAPTGGFSSDVTLTCSVPGSLSTTSCTINPNIVAGGNGSALVTIRGALLTGSFRSPFPFRHRDPGECATFVFALGMVFTAAPSRRRTKRALRKGLLGLLLLCIALAMTSCGGGNSGSGGGTGPNPITGNLTITATGGGITHTTTINVTVY